MMCEKFKHLYLPKSGDIPALRKQYNISMDDIFLLKAYHLEPELKKKISKLWDEETSLTQWIGRHSTGRFDVVRTKPDKDDMTKFSQDMYDVYYELNAAVVYDKWRDKNYKLNHAITINAKNVAKAIEKNEHIEFAVQCIINSCEMSNKCTAKLDNHRVRISEKDELDIIDLLILKHTLEKHLGKDSLVECTSKPGDVFAILIKQARKKLSESDHMPAIRKYALDRKSHQKPNILAKLKNRGDVKSTMEKTNTDLPKVIPNTKEVDTPSANVIDQEEVAIVEPESSPRTAAVISKKQPVNHPNEISLKISELLRKTEKLGGNIGKLGHAHITKAFEDLYKLWKAEKNEKVKQEIRYHIIDLKCLLQLPKYQELNAKNYNLSHCDGDKFKCDPADKLITELLELNVAKKELKKLKHDEMSILKLCGQNLQQFLEFKIKQIPTYLGQLDKMWRIFDSFSLSHFNDKKTKTLLCKMLQKQFATVFTDLGKERGQDNLRNFITKVMDKLCYKGSLRDGKYLWATYDFRLTFQETLGLACLKPEDFMRSISKYINSNCTEKNEHRTLVRKALIRFTRAVEIWNVTSNLPDDDIDATVEKILTGDFSTTKQKEQQ